MKCKIALFRAASESDASARRLRRLGFTVARLPVTVVRTLEYSLPAPPFAAVIATSAKAFGGLATEPDDVLHSRPLFVVGEQTARAARNHGWAVADPVAPTAAALRATLRSRLGPGARVAYFCGRDRSRENDEALSAEFVVEFVEVYATEARSAWSKAEARALDSCAAALHYSARSAAIAEILAQNAGVGERFRNLVHVCLSAGVAASFVEQQFPNVKIADAPNEATLFAALRRACLGFPSS